MQAIRCIKLFAWEGRITDKVAAIRSTQLHYRLRYVILQVIFRAITDALPFIVMLATLCHDLGKPPTTRVIDGRIRSLDHEEQGIAPTQRVLDRLNVRTMEGYDVRKQVVAIVADHLKPGLFSRERDKVGDAAFRRLALKCELDLLYRVAKADSLGRKKEGAPPPDADAQEWFLERAKTLSVTREGPKPLLMGRHLLEMGLPPGPRIGEITDQVYQRQLDGEVRTLDEALAAARTILGK